MKNSIFFLFSLISTCYANMYDLVYPDFKESGECLYGCAEWSDLSNEGSIVNQNISDNLWINKSLIKQSKNYCAWPGNSVNGTGYRNINLPGYAGPFCWCKNTENGFYSKWGYCFPKPHYPVQINLQLSNPNSLVLNFITFCSLDGTEKNCLGKSNKPVVEYYESNNNNNISFKKTGVTHFYSTPSTDGSVKQITRYYNMHFIKLENLTNSTFYNYRINDGYYNSTWSKYYKFKYPDNKGITKFAIYGDMGVFKWNNMQNLKNDFFNEDIDFLVHMGDHSYNIGQMDEHRGDNYMNAYSEILSRFPWMPIIGNHEFYDNEFFHRYLNQTYGVIYDSQFKKENSDKLLDSYKWDKSVRERTTATSSLGYFQSLGLSYSLSMHGSFPSGTSRYYSTDLGLIHLIGIDTNIYYFDTESVYRKAQLEWLEKDLIKANNNRDKVPWILLTSHYPLYCTGCMNDYVSSRWFSSDIDEYVGMPLDEKSENNYIFKEKYKLYSPFFQEELICLKKNNKTTLKNNNYISVKDIEPLMIKYNVDLYMAGHLHYYESLFPSKDYKLIQTNFTNPRAPIHITSGNGGPPSKDPFDNNCPGVNCTKIFSTRKQMNDYSYGRIKIYNKTHLKFQQVFNENSTVFDEIIIEKNI